MVQEGRLLTVAAIALLVILAVGDGDVKVGDHDGIGDIFSGRGKGGFGWGDVVKDGNYLTFTNADGSFGAVAWAEKFPRIVIGSFSSKNADGNKVKTRTGYAFFGAQSVYRAIRNSDSGYSGTVFWQMNATDTTSNGVAVKNVTYVKTFTTTAVGVSGGATSSSVTITVENLILKQAGTVLVNGKSYTGKIGDVKNTFMVNNWPFANGDNRLYLAVYVNSNGKGATNATMISTGASFKFGNGGTVIPTVCTADNQQANVNVTTITDNDGGDDGDEVRQLIVFKFPAFTNFLEYDPVNTLATYGNSASMVATNLMLLIAVVLTLAAYLM